MTAAVLNFNRFPKLMVAMSRSLLALAVDQYFDDYMIVDLRAAGCSGQDSLSFLHSMAGRPFDSEKHQSMAPVNTGLGVHIDVSAVHDDGVLIVSSKWHRCLSVLTMLREAARANFLPPGAASTIHGKLGFILSTAYGRVGKAAAQPLVQRMWHDTDYAFTSQMRHMLEFFEALLPDLPALTIRVGSSQGDEPPIVVYTDASFRATAADGTRQPVAELGYHVVVPRSDGPPTLLYHSHRLEQDALAAFSSTAATLIMQCEIAAATNALGRQPLTTPTTQDVGKARKRPRAPRDSFEPHEAGGLRHFSLKVCRSVQKRERTTYNEVADDIVAEFLGMDPSGAAAADEKNIRRRVYDALNVLVSLNVIGKKGKVIEWGGFPEHLARAELYLLEDSHSDLRANIDRKRKQLQQMIANLVAYQRLVEHNAGRSHSVAPSTRVHMPFILCVAPTPTTVDCQLEEDRRTAMLDFSRSFAIYDDTQVLRCMRLHLCEEENLHRYVPSPLLRYARGAIRNVDEQVSLIGPDADAGRADDTQATTERNTTVARTTPTPLRDDAVKHAAAIASSSSSRSPGNQRVDSS
ncbi:hypothetical protein AB1Y20_009282 [Prymnesium parvum]|uniref:E2F/DP family winged-helix DNA-binding domain-containing protein n=1 Tax=Prymnesium parvum TaxID=97485 RepID=A0AB34K3X0_PRYPA